MRMRKKSTSPNHPLESDCFNRSKNLSRFSGLYLKFFCVEMVNRGCCNQPGRSDISVSLLRSQYLLPGRISSLQSRVSPWCCLLSPAYDFSKLKNLESIKDYSNSHLFEIATGGLRTKKHSIKVRYIDFNGKFGYTGLGRFFFVDDSMYIITNDKQYESEHNPAIL